MEYIFYKDEYEDIGKSQQDHTTMSHRGRKSRPLGSIRHSLTGLDSIPKLPPLATSQSIDKGYEGIHGNAMSVPPARRSPEKEDLHKSRTPLASSRNTSSSRSEGSKSDDSANAAVAEAKRELREALVSILHKV